MHEYPKPENQKRFFLLSLLLHLLLLWLCFLFLSYHNSDKSAANKRINAQNKPNSQASTKQPSVDQKNQGDTPPPPKEQETEEPAELRARQSAFGAPVVFQEMPEIIPTQATNEHADDVGHEMEAQLENDLMPQPSEPDEQITTAQARPPQEQLLPDTSKEALPTPLGSKAVSISKAKELLKETIAALENKELEKPKTVPPKKRPAKSVRKPSAKAKTAAALNQGNSTVSAGPTDKKFTFADLTNGFLENIQAHGQDLINQRGNPNKRPGVEQLKQASYRQKMAWNLQAAFKRAARRTQFMSPSPENSRFECIFHITKDGELENLEVVSSTGHHELDKYIIATTKDAFPLPPIPDHWAQEMLVQSWVFRNIQPNESSYVVNF